MPPPLSAGGAWQIDTNFYKWPPSLRAQIVLSALQTISQHSFGTAHTPRSNSLISPSEAPFNSLNLQLVVCAAQSQCFLFSTLWPNQELKVQLSVQCYPNAMAKGSISTKSIKLNFKTFHSISVAPKWKVFFSKCSDDFLTLELHLNVFLCVWWQPSYSI